MSDGTAHPTLITFSQRISLLQKVSLPQVVCLHRDDEDIVFCTPWILMGWEELSTTTTNEKVEVIMKDVEIPAELR